MTFGKHIKIIGKANPELLGSIKNIESFLKNTINSLNMRLLGNIHLYEVELEIKKLNAERFEDEGGITGVGVLSTSHCSIHTWPLRNYFVADVYSCREFDVSLILQMIKNHFDTTNIKLTDLSHSLVFKE